jgi:protein-S-isoprenylcysteine O-methyltransferase Ste14
MTPWVDRSIALIAAAPFMWATYSRVRSVGLDLPDIVLVAQALVFLATMVSRKAPARVSTNPWYWLLTFVETYWLFLVIAVVRNGRPIVPHWASDSLATFSLLLMIWARLSLGRSIGLVPAQRSLVNHGPYRYMRHPIYLATSLNLVAVALDGYSPLNFAIVALGIFWFGLKSVVEESYLRSDPQYAEYMRRVRWRWLPGIA